MLGRLKKRIENLMGGNSAATAEPTTETSDPSSTHGFAKARRSRPQWQPDPEVTAKLARREAQRREARLLLKERIHNRSVVLMSELRNHLLSEIRERLLAAQYRNGYRALGVRATEEYAQVAQLQMLKAIASLRCVLKSTAES